MCSCFKILDRIVKIEWYEEPDHVGMVPLDYLLENDYSVKSREDHSRARNVEIYQVRKIS